MLATEMGLLITCKYRPFLDSDHQNTLRTTHFWSLTFTTCPSLWIKVSFQSNTNIYWFWGDQAGPVCLPVCHFLCPKHTPPPVCHFLCPIHTPPPVCHFLCPIHTPPPPLSLTSLVLYTLPLRFPSLTSFVLYTLHLHFLTAHSYFLFLQLL